MQRLFKSFLIALLSALVVACVTINVYFPEAAAERAADHFIQDVIGADADESAALLPENGSSGGGPLAALVDFLIPSAHAQSANIDIETPQINAIKQRMAERHRNDLAAWYDAGAIGLDNSGLVQIRERAAVGLAERRRLESVVAEENADRRAVYREIAVANGHPEWEDQIREIFARRWIANAKAGWYYQNDGGDWVRK